MPSTSVGPRHDDGVACITIPAAYADDFHTAIVSEIGLATRMVHDCHREREEAQLERKHELVSVREGDWQSAVDLLAKDARLFDEFHAACYETKHEGGKWPYELRADWDTLSAALETMAREVTGKRVAEQLGMGPIDAAHVADELDALRWATSEAARLREEAFGSPADEGEDES